MVRGSFARVLTTVVVGVCLVLISPGVAQAKGARDVTITGPGLTLPLRVECCQADPNQVGEATGLMYAAFRVWPTPMVRERPVGRLGPRYRATFNFYTGVDQVTPIRQDVYPFARAGVVVYTPPGQRLFDKEARSGWYVSAAQARGGGMTTQNARALLASLGVTCEVVELEAR